MSTEASSEASFAVAVQILRAQMAERGMHRAEIGCFLIEECELRRPGRGTMDIFVMAVTALQMILSQGSPWRQPTKESVMEKRERPTSDLGKTEQPLSEHELKAVNGGTNLVAGLGGPDTKSTGQWLVRPTRTGY